MKAKNVILALAIFIRLFFYFSALSSHSLDKFFLPVTPGQDFFQILNGAYSFLRGGDLQGNLKGVENAYINCCGVNKNVYHPFFTLLVGIPLQFLKPWSAFYLWSFIHLLADIFIFIFLFKKFRKHKYLVPALVFFLINNFAYYEILNNQYHFLLNLTTFLLLYLLSIRKDSLNTGLLYLATLLIKPLGLLWIVPLLIKRHFKTLILGLGFFFLLSLPFYFLPQAKYYFDNLSGALTSNYSDWDIFYVLKYFFDWQFTRIKIIKFLIGVGLVLVTFKRKTSFFRAILFFLLFQLIFYQSTFPYHHSILGPLLALGILLNQIRLNPLEIIALSLLSIPAPLFLSQYVQIEPFIRTQVLVFLTFTLSGELLLAFALLKDSFLNNEKS